MFIFLASVNEISENDLNRLEDLISLIADGDSVALSSLYGITKASVYGFALSILKNAHDAEDILQGCYIKIWESAPQYRSSGKAMAWILTIVKNLCYMKLREGKRSAELDDRQAELIIAPENIALNAEDRQIIKTALKALSEDERQIVMLHAVSGLKFREIAELLDMLTATVLSKYHRAITKMKKLLEE